MTICVRACAPPPLPYFSSPRAYMCTARAACIYPWMNGRKRALPTSLRKCFWNYQRYDLDGQSRILHVHSVTNTQTINVV